MAGWDQVVPSALDKAPAALFEIRYPTFDVKLGQTVPALSLLGPPSLVNWPGIQPGAYYAMSLVDLDPEDAAGYQYKQVNLGLAINIPDGYITKAFIIAPYSPPLPKEGTHRYLVTVFKQPGVLNGIPFAVDDASRHNFDIRKFAKDYSLGDPVAGLYFTVKADETTKDYYSKSIKFSRQVNVSCSIS